MLKNMLNTVRTTNFLLILCTLITVVPSICYADDEEVSVPCVAARKAWTKDGQKDTTLTLVTKGIEVSGEKRLLTDPADAEVDFLGDGSVIGIMARCTPYGVEDEGTDMFPTDFSPENPTTFSCSKGKGMSIRVVSVKNPKLVYKGILKVKVD